MSALTPYAGTSGWSGSSASEDRAKSQDADGTTSARQRAALALVTRFGRDGLTVSEARRGLDLHHGQASSVLSVLHKGGLIARLVERRNRCSVYVAPEHVDGRETSEHGRPRQAPATVALTDDEALALATLLGQLEKAQDIGVRNTLVSTDALSVALNALEARS